LGQPAPEPVSCPVESPAQVAWFLWPPQEVVLEQALAALAEAAVQQPSWVSAPEQPARQRSPALVQQGVVRREPRALVR
jgi:hypothetical protein